MSAQCKSWPHVNMSLFREKFSAIHYTIIACANTFCGKFHWRRHRLPRQRLVRHCTPHSGTAARHLLRGTWPALHEAFRHRLFRCNPIVARTANQPIVSKSVREARTEISARLTPGIIPTRSSAADGCTAGARRYHGGVGQSLFGKGVRRASSKCSCRATDVVVGKLRLRPLSISEILRWVGIYRQATGKWPTKASGGIVGSPFETWHRVDTALRAGTRGLPGGSSLAQLLAQRYGVRNLKQLPPLSIEQILAWADEHYHRTGSWPAPDSGAIAGSGNEKWSGIDNALRLGLRKLAGGASLAKLLAEHRGVRNRKQLPPLTENMILAWADLHFKRTGQWPTARSGPVADAPGETWLAADMALRHGRRRLPGGSSLALLLADKRSARNIWSLPNLTIPQVLGWADAWHARTGKWPTLDAGPISESNGDTWLAVNKALKKGSRGLPKGRSLAELLAVERGARNRTSTPPLTRKRILSWADAHFRRTGEWPTRSSGCVPESPGDTWQSLDAALSQGSRGLLGCSSLARLLARHRDRLNPHDLPSLSVKKILAWADAHHERTGKWPNRASGSVHEEPSEDWNLIDNALRQGLRGLSVRCSLLRLLERKCGVRNPQALPPVTEEQIKDWARSHFDRTGKWPTYRSGPVDEAPGETWRGLDFSLRKGKRSLPGGSSVAKLMAELSKR